MLCRLLSLPPSLVRLVSLVPPAALPPLPMVEVVVPDGLVDVPPVPNVDADVPPAPPLPAVPPVAAEPDGPLDEPPLPIDEALWLSAPVVQATLNSPAVTMPFQSMMESPCLVLLF